MDPPPESCTINLDMINHNVTVPPPNPLSINVDTYGKHYKAIHLGGVKESQSKGLIVHINIEGDRGDNDYAPVASTLIEGGWGGSV